MFYKFVIIVYIYTHIRLENNIEHTLNKHYDIWVFSPTQKVMKQEVNEFSLYGICHNY